MKLQKKSDIPSSVYHVQINKDFTLKQATVLIPYLHTLGIEAVYCSPLYESGSLHGYDVINPNRLNPAIGTMQDYENFCSALQKHGMKQVLDVIPNHMGIKNNPWWQDVLEYGSQSPYADFFDIEWNPSKRELKNKILLALLPEDYGHCLEKEKLKLIWDKGLWVCYEDYRFPIAPQTYGLFFSSLSKENAACLALIEQLKKGPLALKREGKEQLIALHAHSPAVQKYVGSTLRAFNGKKNDPSSFDLLHHLLEQQFYRLAHWLAAGQEINYRRFFNINELASLCIEKKKVLEAHHQLIFKLIAEDKVQGLRIDHPDGLYDPFTYFKRLKAHSPSFIVAEKILDTKEQLPNDWSIEGTVGYEFLNTLNGLFVAAHHEKECTQIYRNFIGTEIDFELLLIDRKKKFISQQMGSEISSLGWHLEKLSEKNRYYRDYTRAVLTEALAAVIACFPVYRTYIREDGVVGERDKKYIIQAIEKAQALAQHIDSSIFDYIRGILLLTLDFDKDGKKKMKRIVMRFQQVTAPVMAKGLEDSTYYIYNRLLSLNEVGGNPKIFGIRPKEFHDFNAYKLAHWPLGFLASSTHDTKMSEDVRMRINVLSEIPKQWEKRTAQWKKANAKFKQQSHGALVPDCNTEYYIYQMLIGIWPSAPGYAHRERLWECLFKAIREAGIYTHWRVPHADYEKAVQAFLLSILKPSKKNGFLSSFLELERYVTSCSKWNSLSSLVLKLGSCGIVDIYQGNERWSYTLMDPDNRRPISFDTHLLQKLKKDPADKTFITLHGLNFRRHYKELFLHGDYIPLKIEQDNEEKTIAFMRKGKEGCVLVLAGRFFTGGTLASPLSPSYLRNVSLCVPKELLGMEFTDIFTNRKIRITQSSIPLADIFKNVPYAMLANNTNLTK